MSPPTSSEAEADATIAAIMERHGVRIGLSEFHAAVNVTFHEFESEVYDREHADMWESVPRQIQLLVEDCYRDAQASHPLPEKIRLLDIGCGTGLATDSLLKTEIGRRIYAIDLLDSSPAMLRQAKERSSGWKAPVTFHEGLVESLDDSIKFDWTITCSVLHHVPHLKSFMEAVRRLQSPSAFFCHIQDPNGDYLTDSELRERIARRNRFSLPEWARRLAPGRLASRIFREITGKPTDDLVAKTSRALIERGVLATPLQAGELYAITDIHVQNERGISIGEIQRWRADWRLISRRSYGFYGELRSTLPPAYRQSEDELIGQGALNGFHIGAAWRLIPANAADSS